MVQSTEQNQPLETQLSSLFDELETKLESEGSDETGFDTISKEWEEFVDLRANGKLVFNAQALLMMQINGPLEAHIKDTLVESNNTSIAVETRPDEKWIAVQITPSDVESPKFAKQLGASDSFYSEALLIYLSTAGRGFQRHIWMPFSTPDNPIPLGYTDDFHLKRKPSSLLAKKVYHDIEREESQKPKPVTPNSLALLSKVLRQVEAVKT